LDIIVIGAEGAGQADRIRERGWGVIGLPPGQPLTTLGTAPAGVVAIAAEVTQDVGETAKLLGLPLTTVAAGQEIPAAFLDEVAKRADARPMPAAVRDVVLEPFVSAVGLTFRELTFVEAQLLATYARPRLRALGDLTGVIALHGATEGCLGLSFLARSARAFGGRFLVEVTRDPDEALIRDSVGEFANVIAGQAKALLAETPLAFRFGTPSVVAGPGAEVGPEGECLVFAFGSPLGPIALQLVLHT
jgi:chemotaxis protein CheX